MRAPVVAAAAGALLVAGGIAGASIQWSSQSQIMASVVAPQVHLSLGSKADDERWLTGSTVSASGTWFSTTIIGRSGGDVRVRDVVRVTNDAATTRSVEMEGSQVSDARVLAYAWTVRDGGTTVAVLDMLQPSPSVTFDLPPGTFEIDLRLRLLPGASQSDTSYAGQLWLTIS